MRRWLLLTLPPLIASLATLPARAQDEPPPGADAKPLRFEGAIGLITHYGPSYAGAEDDRIRLRPAGFVRYGRITISGAGGFRTRRDDDVERGVTASLIERDQLRLSLSGRWTHGRRESDSDRLDGMGDIDGTILLRAALRWTPSGPWSYGLAVSADAAGHQHGTTLDLGVSRQWRLDPDTKLNLSTSLSFADRTHLQTWYGVTPEQSSRSGHPVYTPGAGLLDAELGVSLRHDFGRRWSGFVSTGASLQLGPAANSPLVRQPLGWSVGTGLVWRF